MLHFKALTLIVLSFLIVGCGGGGSTSNDGIQHTPDTITVNETPTTDENTPLMMADITGLYDMSDFIYNLQGVGLWNEKYIAVYDNGLVVTFDYLGDSFDNLQNCYSVIKSSVRELDNGLFTWYNSEGYGVDVEITITDNELKLLIGEWVMISGYETNQQIQNFNLCE